VTDWLPWARYYVNDLGFSVIPMGENKKPLIKWKEYQTRRPTNEELSEWPRENLAILTGPLSNLVVVDCESLEDARWFWENRGKARMVAKTRRGYHLYFRHPGFPVRNAQYVENRYDVRGDGGFVLAAPSTHSAGCYQWTTPVYPGRDLTPFQEQWRPPTQHATLDSKEVRDGIKYISKIRAVAGQGGHGNTYRAAIRLRQSGMSESEALLTMLEWNRHNAEPPWTERELLHKVTSAYSMGA
jgi:hypothetical protein